MRELFADGQRDAGDDLMDERTEQDRRREARERELAADLAVASDLMGDVELDSGEWQECQQVEIQRAAATCCSLCVPASTPCPTLINHFPGAALKAALTAKPTTKADFAELSKNIIAAITSKHEANPLYAAFVEQFGKDLCENLTAVQTRKVSSALSVLGNTKQQEERDKASGKKKVSLAATQVGGHPASRGPDVDTLSFMC